MLPTNPFPLLRFRLMLCWFASAAAAAAAAVTGAAAAAAAAALLYATLHRNYPYHLACPVIRATAELEAPMV